ncbi:Translin [Trametes versicolor FP-101664 SS1]|uniref:Translin n=1 Tax=Trametes versicolor (strain FP-101664) TaxID=717944 RepID=UPI0004623BB1|nr:Translin [Trametes versicolor FP-101664 SS1]EIW64521.1 Translin [Trametes versicolor FP-101664 SS1]
MTSLASRPSIVHAFEQFREELDDYNDRRERLIKSSRDITNLSKKLIFLLHRTVTEDAIETDDRVLGLRAAARAKGKLAEIQSLFAALRGELAGDRFWHHQRNISPGVQEYIEALSFAHYLEHRTLISYDQVQSTLSDCDGIPFFPLSLEDYLLGLADLTGELMRFAIAAISRRGGRQKASDVCSFVRACKADFEGLTPHFKELRKKQSVTTQSLEKIEDAAYAVVVRTSEYDMPPELLDDLVAQTLSRAADHGGFGEESRRKRPRDSDYDMNDD